MTGQANTPVQFHDWITRQKSVPVVEVMKRY